MVRIRRWRRVIVSVLLGGAAGGLINGLALASDRGQWVWVIEMAMSVGMFAFAVWNVWEERKEWELESKEVHHE